MTAPEVRTYIGYSGWASRKVLEAALALPPEDRTKPMRVSHESIANTLAHIYFGDAIWFSRIADPDYPVPPHDGLPSLDFVIEEWPRLQAKWEAWAKAVTDSDLARQVPFKSRFVGNAGLPAWQIVVHAVNHATLHRGQYRHAASAWQEAARDGHRSLLLRTSCACRQLVRFAPNTAFWDSTDNVPHQALVRDARSSPYGQEAACKIMPKWRCCCWGSPFSLGGRP